MVQRGTAVASNDAISSPVVPSRWVLVLESILLQQVLGLFADTKVNEKPFGNRQMRRNKRGSIFCAANSYLQTVIIYLI